MMTQLTDDYMRQRVSVSKRIYAYRGDNRDSSYTFFTTNFPQIPYIILLSVV